MSQKWVFLILSVLEILTTPTYSNEINKNCIELTTNVSAFLKCLSSREKREVLSCDKCCSCRSNHCQNYCSSNCRPINCQRNCNDCNRKCDISCESQNITSCQNCCSNINCQELSKPTNCCNDTRIEEPIGIIYEAKQKNDANDSEATTLHCDDCDTDDGSSMPNIFLPQTMYPSYVGINRTDENNLNINSNSALQNNISLNHSYRTESKLNNTNNIYIPIFANATSVNKISVNVTYPVHVVFDGQDRIFQNRNSTGNSTNYITSGSYTAPQFPIIPLSDSFFQRHPFMNPFFNYHGSVNQLSNTSELDRNLDITSELDESVLTIPELKKENSSRLSMDLLSALQRRSDIEQSKLSYTPFSEIKFTPPNNNYNKITKMNDCERSSIQQIDTKPVQWDSNLDLAKFQSSNQPITNVYPWNLYQKPDIKFDYSQWNVNEFPWMNTHLTQNQFQNTYSNLNNMQWFQPQPLNINVEEIQPKDHELQWTQSLIPNTNIQSVHSKLDTLQWPQSKISEINTYPKLDTSLWPFSKDSDINLEKTHPKINGLQWPYLQRPEINTQNIQHFQWSQPLPLENRSTDTKLQLSRLYENQNQFIDLNSNNQSPELSSMNQIINKEQYLNPKLDSSPLEANLNMWKRDCCIMIRPNCNYTLSPPYVECTKPTKFWTCGMQCFHNYLDGSMHRSPINCIGSYCKNIPTKELLSEHYPTKDTINIANVPNIN